MSTGLATQNGWNDLAFTGTTNNVKVLAQLMVVIQMLHSY